MGVRVRLLLVDDDEGLRALLRATFASLDVEVDEADSTAAAARLVLERRPDAIVLDVAMPGGDGLSFCLQLKRDPETRGIPVVVLSGAPSPADGAASSGADAFVAKPFS